jgi:signal transduction histidine kinase
MGIPSENLTRLYEPFFTTKPEGTGLGLPITRRIIHEHKGSISVHSEPGEGTAFTIILPLLAKS